MRKPDSILNKIAAVVAQYPGKTGAELSAFLKTPTAYRRLSEVASLGLIEARGTKVCQVSNKTAKTWYACDKPEKINRQGETQNQMRKRLEGRIHLLVNENEKLSKKVARMYMALEPYAEQPGPQMANLPCHSGICSAAECRRCSRAIEAYCAKEDIDNA